MKMLVRTLSMYLASAGLLTATSTTLAGSADDAWDVSQGTVITQFTPNPGLPGNGPGMFGGDAGEGSPFAVERFNTVFPDLLPAGTVHSIEWSTASPITLTGYHLQAARDGSNGRSFSLFRLLADTGSGFVLISSVDTTALYTGGPAALELDLTQTLPAVTAQSFRAEFTQATGLFGQSGPRVVELDAITAVPEPASWALMLGGCVGLAAWLRRRLPH